jgi:hypothetical protein
VHIHMCVHAFVCAYMCVRVPESMRVHALTCEAVMSRVGQNRIYALYETVRLVIFLPKDRIYTVYSWSWPTTSYEPSPPQQHATQQKPTRLRASRHALDVV